MLSRRYLRIAVILGFSTLMLLPAALGIQHGDTREDVVRELGEAYSVMRFGAFETLQFKDGTRVSLQNGIVTVVEGGRQTGGSLRTAATAPQVPQDHSQASKVVPKEAPAPDRGGPKPAPNQAVNTSRPAPGDSSGGVKAPSRASEALTESTRPNKIASSTNLSPFSIVAKLGQHPMVFSGNSAKAFNSVAALTPRLVLMARGFSLVFLGLLIGVYLFNCFCFGRICRKGGQEGGVLVWIPLAQLIPLVRVARLPLWTPILVIVPLVNCVFMMALWAKICVALGKSPWLVLLLLVPVANFGLIAYLAFCGGTPQPPRFEHSFGTQTRQPEAVSV
jgi:hypothetical protein